MSGWVLVAIWTFSLLDTSTSQNGVCYLSTSRQVSVTAYTSSSFTDAYRCGIFGWDRCRRTLYRQTSRTEYATRYQSVFGCCSGYHEIGSSTCQKIGEVRLVGGVSSFEGRIEVFLNGEWGTVCSDGWSENDVKVVCRQLGHTNTQYTPRISSFGAGSGAIHMSSVQCSGTESLLTSCPHQTSHTCEHAQDAGVRCAQCAEASIRLRGGSALHEGRVEVCLGGGWGTVCDTGWNMNAAIVACRQLGFHSDGATALSSAPFGQGVDLPIAMANLTCTADETHLIDCTHLNANSISSCSHSEDAGVRCPPPLAPPASLEALNIQATIFTLSWSLPPADQRVKFLITEFDINCTTDDYPNWSAKVSSNSTLTYQRNDAEEYTQYTCCVAALEDLGGRRKGNSRCVNVLTKEAVPSGIPLNLTVRALSGFALESMWEPPSLQHRNGVISHYRVNITREAEPIDELISYHPATTSLIIGSLLPQHEYNLSVEAVNSEGVGPSAATSIMMPQNDDSGEVQLYAGVGGGVATLIVIVIVALVAVVCRKKNMTSLQHDLQKNNPACAPSFPSEQGTNEEDVIYDYPEVNGSPEPNNTKKHTKPELPPRDKLTTRSTANDVTLVTGNAPSSKSVQHTNEREIIYEYPDINDYHESPESHNTKNATKHMKPPPPPRVKLTTKNARPTQKNATPTPANVGPLDEFFDNSFKQGSASVKSPPPPSKPPRVQLPTKNATTREEPESAVSLDDHDNSTSPPSKQHSASMKSPPPHLPKKARHLAGNCQANDPKTSQAYYSLKTETMQKDRVYN